MKQKVGLLGGTFDPPHYGHLLIANEVLHHLSLDCIEFMPNKIPPHKENNSGTTAQQRLDMIQLAIKDHPHFFIETIELEREGKSYTIDTMGELLKKYPNKEYYFIIGADMVEYLPHWHRIDELVEIVQFVGVKRPHYEVKSPYPILEVDVPELEISSSMIRNRIRKKQPIKYLLPDECIQYIKEHRLYES